MVDVLGTKLGRYEIRERLGKGGMAAVYKAWDTNLERWVAVKVLHDHLVDESGFKERFQREAKVVANLNHPNIVQVYDFSVEERGSTPIYYMVMTYVSGQSLKSLLSERHALGQRLSIDEISRVMRDVCSALHYAHNQGMVHRDVTPANILFNERGEAVLTDFGIARILSDARLTQSGMTTGTPMYMPPEQGMGKDSDKRSDIYSLGVILYEMLAGKTPYDGDSAIAVIMKHIQEPLPSLRQENSELSPSMESVVFRTLAKEPGDRYQDANDLLRDYTQALDGAVVPALQETKAPAPILTQANKEAPSTITLPTSPTMSQSTDQSGPRSVQAINKPAGVPYPFIVAGIFVVVLALVLAEIVPMMMSARTKDIGSASPTISSTLQTPSAQATNRVDSMTGGPLTFTDDFGTDRHGLDWQITSADSGTLRRIEDGVYHLRTTAPRMALTALFDPDRQYAEMFQYEADFTISTDSQPDTGTGIVFRYVDEDNYYVFGVNGQAQISIWSRLKGVWVELRQSPVKWTPADSAVPQGQINHLKLVDLGKRFKGYVNGKLVVDMDAAPQIPAGAIGVYVGTTSEKNAEKPLADVKVDNWKTSVATIDDVQPTKTIESMTQLDEVTPTKTVEAMTGETSGTP